MNYLSQSFHNPVKTINNLIVQMRKLSFKELINLQKVTKPVRG